MFVFCFLLTFPGELCFWDRIDVATFITTHSLLPVIKIIFQKFQYGIPYVCNLQIVQPLCHTSSKTFDISKKTPIVSTDEFVSKFMNFMRYCEKLVDT